MSDFMGAYGPFLIATLAGVTSLIVAFITTWAMRKKVSADAAKQLTQIALSLVDPLKDEVEELKKEYQLLEAEVAKLKAENEMLHRWSQLLFSQVVESGADPIPFDKVRALSH